VASDRVFCCFDSHKTQIPRPEKDTSYRASSIISCPSYILWALIRCPHQRHEVLSEPVQRQFPRFRRLVFSARESPAPMAFSSRSSVQKFRAPVLEGHRPFPVGTAKSRLLHFPKRMRVVMQFAYDRIQKSQPQQIANRRKLWANASSPANCVRKARIKVQNSWARVFFIRSKHSNLHKKSSKLKKMGTIHAQLES